MLLSTTVEPRYEILPLYSLNSCHVQVSNSCYNININTVLNFLLKITLSCHFFRPSLKIICQYFTDAQISVRRECFQCNFMLLKFSSSAFKCISKFYVNALIIYTNIPHFNHSRSLSLISGNGKFQFAYILDKVQVCRMPGVCPGNENNSSQKCALILLGCTCTSHMTLIPDVNKPVESVFTSIFLFNHSRSCPLCTYSKHNKVAHFLVRALKVTISVEILIVPK